MSLSSFNELWKRSALFLGTVGGALWLTRTRFRATSVVHYRDLPLMYRLALGFLRGPPVVIILVLFVVCRLKRTCDPLGLVSTKKEQTLPFFIQTACSFERAGLNLGPHFTPERRCMREILIARAPMRRLFEVFDWFTTKTTRSGVAQSFTLSTKRFVLCELDTVILVRSFKAVPLLSPNSPFFLENHAGPLFFGGLFCKPQTNPNQERVNTCTASTQNGTDIQKFYQKNLTCHHSLYILFYKPKTEGNKTSKQRSENQNGKAKKDSLYSVFVTVLRATLNWLSSLGLGQFAPSSAKTFGWGITPVSLEWHSSLSDTLTTLTDSDGCFRSALHNLELRHVLPISGTCLLIGTRGLGDSHSDTVERSLAIQEFIHWSI
ncbi:hypothetical protein PAPYR_11265 [Paratrimastix pyriformis]|uniref:Uncharacterized protein n=1 Tax=Paratrimastix pyriformis TaxID=342808 RepID=A0ABQ8U457_9EUKA|nr:hypothetical protein PAPYR_11265 [Paratrimastix pyriformis]